MGCKVGVLIDPSEFKIHGIHVTMNVLHVAVYVCYCHEQGTSNF